MFNLNYPKFWQYKGFLSYLLLPFSLLYWLVIKIRYLLITPIKFNAKLICIGNISVGGTGKTQIVILLAKLLKKMDINFLIITNGYKSKLTTAKIVEEHDDPELVGDEAILLKNYAKVIVAKKIKYACALVNKIKPQVIILDDRMQNPSIYKDLIVLCIDTVRLFGNGFLLPAGPLRESKKDGFKKANIVIAIGNEFSNNVKSKIPSFNALISPEDNNLDIKIKYFAFCGIGDPERFLISLKNAQLKVVGHKFFSDHYYYKDSDINFLKEQSMLYNAELITTEKDYVKIKNKLLIKCFKIHLIIDRPSEFNSLIYETINQAS